MIKIGIVGGTGYTGVELLRLLAQHPQADVRAITSREDAGTPVADMFPSLRGRYDLAFTDPADADLDVLRRRVLRHAARRRDGAGARARSAPACAIIDLAADFRLKDLAVFEKWYGMPHACPDLLAEAVYGLPEVNREAIRKARIVGNPGCYPTAMQLGFAAAARGRRRRRRAPDRRLQVRRLRRRPQGRDRAAVCRGVRQLQGLRRRRAIATSPRPSRSSRALSRDAGRPRLHAAPGADDPRHPRDALRRAHARRTSTCRRCSRSATPASPSST